MRMHKANVERRMKTSDNLDSRVYWSQRNDKLKRYNRNESLDPSWYTDNIYSNHSIEDEEEDDFFVDNEKFDRFFDQSNGYDYHASDDQNYFERKRGRIPHSDVEFNYPKSRSCCFGGGYNERPKPHLIPKSSSFSVVGRRGSYNMRSRENSHEYSNGNNTEQSSYRKYYCWQNGERDCDKYAEVKEIYHIDRDRDIYKKSKNDIMMQTQQTNANCIRNIWRRREHYKNNILNEINGNYNDDYDFGVDEKYRSDDLRKRHSYDSHFVEEYLIVHDTVKPSTRNDSHLTDPYDYLSNSKHRNSIENIYDEEVKLLNDPIDNEHDDNSNMIFDDINAAPVVKNHARSKSFLEVKPPNRYDDTDSDSTDLDLDDFNFDFEKYWSELDKTTALTSNSRYDLDYRNNNLVNSHSHSTIKDKNINLDKYNNGQFRRDINMNERANDNTDSQYMHDYKQNILDLLPSPTHTARPRYSYTKSSPIDNHQYDYHRNRANGNTGSDLTKLSPIDDDLPSHDIYVETIQEPVTVSTNNNSRKNTSSQRNSRSNTALSLINNIFSIYKPKKYSPVNVRSRTKPDMSSKNMNVSSTVRPLGAPHNDFMTSVKRPLTIRSTASSSSRYNVNRVFSSSVDQPHFKIIPEKTGLKISPLYRFGYGVDESKLRLKCTARPLLFPL